MTRLAVLLAAACLLAAGCSAAPPVSGGARPDPAAGSGRLETGVSLGTAGLPTAASIAAWAAKTGAHPQMVEYYEGFGTPLDENAVWAIRHAGAEPVIGLDTGGFSLAAIAAGRYDQWLRAYAASAARLPFPVAFSFDHEFNGPWWPWSFDKQGSAEFVAAWRHVYGVFRAAKVKATWIWAANVSDSQTTALAPFWPGAAYVDVVGLDGYYTHPYSTFANVFTPTIKQVRALTGKPVLITETGANPVAGRPRAIADLFRGAAKAGVIGLIWVDHDKPSAHGPAHNWLIDNDPAALAAFRKAESPGA